MNRGALYGFVNSVLSPMAINQSGIMHLLNGNRENLPLEEVKVQVLIVDISARVTLIQIYANPSDTATSRCKYCFPVPASGAICEFELSTSDGRIVRGISKETVTAREDFEKAAEKGELAGLLDYVTDDIFTISIGSIPGNATITVKLVYVLSLINDDYQNEVRFQLPMHVGKRYGIPHTGLEMSSISQPSSRTRIRLSADIQMSGQIHAVTSPTHQNETKENRYVSYDGRPSKRRTKVSFRSRIFMERSFVLVIHADKLHDPRCFSEVLHHKDGEITTAMQLTIIPKFIIPHILSQEYIFVVDRSGSMAGGRLEMAKQTLSMLLRMLPVSETIFNVFYFNNICSKLWSRSQAYNQANLASATKYSDSNTAGGGTEIQKALEAAIRSRHSGLPTAIFVLTDGEVTDITETVSLVSRSVANSPANAPLRLFSLGIGDTVSTALCEGIACAGNGFCLLATETEDIVGKCARLFKAARTPFIGKIDLDWGISTASVEQAPEYISEMHSGARLDVLVIAKGKHVPKTVTLRGQLANTGELFQSKIPTQAVCLANAGSGVHLVHTQAAWRLIQKHEERLNTHNNPSDDERLKKIIIQLGEEYQLSSCFTSFVAVESHTKARKFDVRIRSFWKPWSHWFSGSETRTPDDGDILHGQASSNTIGRVFRNLFIYLSSGSNSSQNTPQVHQCFPGAWPDQADFWSDNDGDEDEDEEDCGSCETFSTLSSLNSHSDQWSQWSSSDESPPAVSENLFQVQQSSPRLLPISLVPDSVREGLILSHQPLDIPVQPPIPLKVLQLVKLQNFDGSYDYMSLQPLFGAALVNEADLLSVDRMIWATALSVAYIKRCLSDRQDLASDLLDKAYGFLEGSNVSDVSVLLIKADELLDKIADSIGT